MITPSVLVTVPEAAALLRLSRATIYRMLARGDLPSVKQGAARRIPRTALEAWVARHSAASTPCSGPSTRTGTQFHVIKGDER
jgi:excisionase family DNA binding protein